MKQIIQSYVLKIHLQKFYLYLIFLTINNFFLNIELSFNSTFLLLDTQLSNLSEDKPLQWRYKAWVAASLKGYTFIIDVFQGQQGGMSSKYKA